MSTNAYGQERDMYYIHSSQGEMIGSCVYAEDAAYLVALQGEGATICNDKNTTVWVEGEEETNADISIDACAEIIYSRDSE